MGYWKVLPTGTYVGLWYWNFLRGKIFQSLAKIFKPIYQKVRAQNLYKLGLINVSILQEAKCFNTPISYTNDKNVITPQ